MASYSVNVASDTLGQPAGNLTFSFSRPLDMSRGVWECALLQLGVWYTWLNLSSTSYNNTSFSFSDGTTTRSATLRNGVYNALDLIQAIYDTIEQLTSTSVADSIVLSVSQATLGFTLLLSNGCTLDLSAGGTSNMYVLFGAAQTTYTTQNTLIYFPEQADITAGTNVLNVRAPGLVSSNTVNGQPSNILFSFSPYSAPGSLLSYTPVSPIWGEVPSQVLSSLTLQITDQAGRVVDFVNGPGNTNNGSTFTILFRERR